MKREVSLGLISALLLGSMFGVFFQIQVVDAQGTITIRDDGMIIPDDVPITKTDSTTFVFTGDTEVGMNLVVEMHHAVIDGGGYSLSGVGNRTGVFIQGRSAVTIMNLTIQDFQVGIKLETSGVCRIVSNTIIDNEGDGIILTYYSRSNFVWQNVIQGNGGDGLKITDNSDQNTISGNIIKENMGNGIYIEGSSYNSISSNAFIDNYSQVGDYTGGENYWSKDYQFGGNYWSDYVDIYPQTDDFSGPDQNQPDPDGIWDYPYYVYPTEEVNDTYPLVNLKIRTRITLELSSEAIYEGDSITFSGKIFPDISEANVILTIDAPSGDLFYRNVSSQSDGIYYYESYVPNEIGTWDVKASWSGNFTHTDSQTEYKSFTVSEGSADEDLWEIIGRWIRAIPGFPWESIMIGALLGFGTLYLITRKKRLVSSISD